MFLAIIEILILLVLILANGIFAMSEIAIISARKSRLKKLADRGDDRARVALELANSPNQFLATVQVGITLIGILAGAFGGATLSGKLSVIINTVPLLSPISPTLSFLIVVLIITYLSLTIGEIVPKRIALNNAEKIAMMMAYPMQTFATKVSPIVRVLSQSTEAVLRLLRVQQTVEPPVTEEEIRTLIKQGAQSGVIEEAEQDIIESVFGLNDQPVSALMTPRHKVVWVELKEPREQIVDKITKSNFSRFPIARASLDNIQGVVRSKDILSFIASGKSLDIKACIRKPLFIPENKTVSAAIELFKKSQADIALIIDEYGSFEGVLTLHDILEAVVGDIPGAKPHAVKRDDGSWLMDGMLSTSEFKKIFKLGKLPEEEEGGYLTLGGFVIMYLGRIPKAADTFAWNNLKIEILDMDGHRVDKVLVTPVE